MIYETKYCTKCGRLSEIRNLDGTEWPLEAPCVCYFCRTCGKMKEYPKYTESQKHITALCNCGKEKK